MIKTHRDVVSSLKGASFRKVTCDGRTWSVRQIRTLKNWARNGSPPVVDFSAVMRIWKGRS